VSPDGGLDEIYLCEATPGDARALAELRCSRGAWYENEVEAYVNNEMPKLLSHEAMFNRQLLVMEGDNVIGCCGHQLDALRMDGEKDVFLARLAVMAFDLRHRGRELADGGRLSDAVFKALASDAVKGHPGKALTAVVAGDNYRSLAMLERNGEWAQIQWGPKHVRLTANMEPAEG
jgi:hypothetical protein